MSRFQFVWWGWRDACLLFHRFDNGLRCVYEWSLRLGPLEIRKWAPAAIDALLHGAAK